MKKLLSFLAVVLISAAVFAQSVTLTFTAKDAANQHVQLNRVSITNLTKGWQETIYWPDTTLTMQNGTGIADIEMQGRASLQLSQNNPNPFTVTTEVSMMVAEEDEVMLDIADVNGKIVGTYRMRPQVGTHQFRITLSTAGTYIMTARQNGQTSSIKMVCNGGGDGNRIEYTGNDGNASHASATQSKNGPKYTTTRPFNFGDQMEYVGYAAINGSEAESQRIMQAQGASQTFTLQFTETQTQVQLPTVITSAVSNITSSSATAGGTVISDGGATVFDRGVCFSTASMPTVSDNCIHIGQGTGAFSDNITGLNDNTTYYVRAYAMSNAGIAYGNEVSFTTTSTVAITVTTDPVTGITINVATCGGTVIYDGEENIMVRGVCWNTSPNPTANHNHTTDGSGVGHFTSQLTSLNPGTTYYVRAYATSVFGTVYGNEVEYTHIILPTVTTASVSNITANTVTCGGDVTNSGGATVTARGVCWSTSQNPTISDSHTTNGTGTGSFTSNITGLAPLTTYYVRAYATNSNGTAYGEQLNFTTYAAIPTVTTNVLSNITSNSVTCGGYVTAAGAATVTTRGVCWSTSQNPTVNDSHTTDGSGTGNFTSSIIGLTPTVKYYVRAYATNSVGTGYGDELYFTTPGAYDGQPCPGAATVTDYDNNTYNTVMIGTQCWMKENLRTTHYSNGTSIPLGTSASTTTPYRYNPNDNASNVPTYGYLYNWPAVLHGASSSSSNPSGVQGICPTGWHVPSDAEWTQLTDYLRSQSQYVCNNNSNGIAKALASTTGWNSSTTACAVGNNQSSNNATGFSALPAGMFVPTSIVILNTFGEEAIFWSATVFEDDHAFFYKLGYANAGVSHGASYEYYSSSVRCVKDAGSTVTVPTVTTTSVTSVAATSATCGGNVTSDGGATVTTRGVCWSTSQNPTVNDSHTTNGSGTGSFTSSITGLTAGSTYYVRAYATNNFGIGYGNQISFIAASSVIIQEGFDNATVPTGWTAIDADGDGHNWGEAGDLYQGFAGHTGLGISSASYISNVGALTPDNWLITPAISLTNNSTLTFWVAAQDASWADEHYGVYISTTGTSTSNFTLLFEEDMDANGGSRTQGQWKQKIVNLSAYTGQTVYIAFRHFGCTDQFWLNLDDVIISY